MMKKNGFSRCAEMYIGRLRKEGRYSTAHVYDECSSFFYEGFVALPTVCFPDKSPANACGVTGSIFMSSRL